MAAIQKRTWVDRKGAQRTEIRDELRQIRPDGFDNRLWPELKAICDAIDVEEAEG